MNEKIIEIGLKTGMLNYVDNETPRRYFLADWADEFCLQEFAESIIKECIACCGAQADGKNIRKRFGLPVESNVKYPSQEPQGHHTQYGREYDKPNG